MLAALSGTAARAASLAAVDLANRRAGRTVYASSWHGQGEASIHYVTAGQGPTILFVHGFPSFWLCWIRQMEALRSRFRVVAIDAPGAGASARPAATEAYRVDRLAGQLQTLLADLAPDGDAVIVGHDWGAALAFAHAAACPESQLGVVGIAAPPFNQFLTLLDSDPEQQGRSEYMTRLRNLTAESAREVSQALASGAYAGLAERGDIDTAEAALFEQACGDPAALLGGASWYAASLPGKSRCLAECLWPAHDPALAVPSCLIWGQADQTFVAHAPDQFAAKNPGSEVSHLLGIGHWCMLQAADAVTERIANFADRQFEREA